MLNIGDIARSLSTIGGRTVNTWSISSSVVSLPRVNKREPWAVASETPIARRKGDDFKALDVHVEPLDAAIPS